MTPEPIKFLLVDDTADNLVALEPLLRRDGLELLLARSGSEALELLLLHDVSLALLDVQMPLMDGFELAELMRGAKRTRHVPIIFLTAGDREPSRVFTGYESGAVDFLFKPIDPRILKSKADVFFELACQRRELSQALKINEMFVAILGHDLRNPLGAVIAGAELLQRQVTDERQLLTLRRMTASGRRMSEMIEQLLDLTRARLVGGLYLTPKHLDVAALVHRSVDELRATNPHREIVIDVDGDCTTWGDPDRLLQLFSNLVGNALHHGTRGAPISLGIAGREREIVIRIRNGGVIPPEILPSVFEPFRGRTTAQAGGPGLGLGLGLFISQQIATAHDGDIGVVSNSTSGTEFTVRLPRRRDARDRLTCGPRVP